MDGVARRRGRTTTGLWIALALGHLRGGSDQPRHSEEQIRSRRSAASTGQTLTVMTRNLYLGGNIDRPIRAAYDRTGAESVLALGHANHELREIVDRTDFSTRSRLLAAEIAAARPDLVGLQEVALWRHGPMQLDKIGLLNATEVDFDSWRSCSAIWPAAGRRMRLRRRAGVGCGGAGLHRQPLVRGRRGGRGCTADRSRRDLVSS